MKISANGYVAIILIAGMSLAAYIYTEVPESSASQIPLLFAFVGGIVTLLLKQGGTDQVVAEVKTAAEAAKVAAKVATVESVKSKDASRATAQSLIGVVDSVDLIHGIVNHSKDLVTAELAESRTTNQALAREIAGLRAALTATQVAPGSDVAAILADEVVVHPLDTPTPAADAVKADEAKRPPTTKPIRVPPAQPDPITGDHS